MVMMVVVGLFFRTWRGRHWPWMCGHVIHSHVRESVAAIKKEGQVAGADQENRPSFPYQPQENARPKLKS
jgi:uncharacterized membrane protein YccC